METRILQKENYDDFKFIYIFGDSHALSFGPGNTIIKNKYNIQNLYRDSASARGLNNINSKLNLGSIIENFIITKTGNFSGISGKIPSNSNELNNYYVFKFGQVDIQINYYFKIFVKKEIVNKEIFFMDIINDYITYLMNLKNKFENINILVCGINLPSPYNFSKYLYNIFIQEDKLFNQDILNEIKLSDMNKDTIIFNDLLKNECIKNNIIYFDTIEECSYKKDNDIYIKSEFIGDDHHYNGCRDIGTLQNRISNYNKKNNISILDPITHPLFSLTYTVFINKLLNSINYKVYEKITVTYKNFIKNFEFINFQNYNIIKDKDCIVIEEINNDPKYNYSFGLIIPEIYYNHKIKINIESYDNENKKINIYNIYNGKEWILNTNLDKEIFIYSIDSKARINSNQNKYIKIKKIEFIIIKS